MVLDWWTHENVVINVLTDIHLTGSHYLVPPVQFVLIRFLYNFSMTHNNFFPNLHNWNLEVWNLIVRSYIKIQNTKSYVWFSELEQVRDDKSQWLDNDFNLISSIISSVQLKGKKQEAKKLNKLTIWFSYGKKVLVPSPITALFLGPPLSNPCLGGGTTTSILRQKGHDDWDRSHLSTHPTWNSCPQCGSFLISSPSSNSVRHITHSFCFSISAGLSYRVFGRAFKALFFRPRLGGGGGKGSWIWTCCCGAKLDSVALSPDESWPRLLLQRLMKARPAKHTMAQSKAARMTTISAVKLFWDSSVEVVVMTAEEVGGRGNCEEVAAAAANWRSALMAASSNWSTGD